MSVKIGFAGLGAMGFGMAANLVRNGYTVQGYDVYEPTLQRFEEAGGIASRSPQEAAFGVDIFIVMVANAAQARCVLFDRTGAVQSLKTGSCLILCSTVPAAFLHEIKGKLDSLGRQDIALIDSPVSGGTARAANGTLTILSSASHEDLAKADEILRQMSEKLYILPGGIGCASNVKMINQLLAGVHIAAAAEAMGFAAKAGLNTTLVYEVLKSSSWMFENRVPHMLTDDWTPHSALDIFVKDMGIVTSTARSYGFSVPLSSTAYQLYLNGSAQGFGREDDAGVVRTFVPQDPSAVHKLSHARDPIADRTPATTPIEINKIGLIGLKSSRGMAKGLLRAGFEVFGFDESSQAVEKFVRGETKAHAAQTVVELSKDAQVLIIVDARPAEVDDILFGNGKCVTLLADNATIILSSTLSPTYVLSLPSKIRMFRQDVEIVDAPVIDRPVDDSPPRIISSGSVTGISRTSSVVNAMSGLFQEQNVVVGELGIASTIKVVNQMLTGIHLIAAAEAMAFGAKLGLDTDSLYEIIRNAAGGSRVFASSVPHMLAASWTELPSLSNLIQDMDIVLDEADRLKYPAALSLASQQLYLLGASQGWTEDSASGIVRLWERNGVSVSKKYYPREYAKISKSETLASLPPVNPFDSVQVIQSHLGKGKTPLLVILDDDPTGTQTCHDISVLTVWDVPTLETEFNNAATGFYILTNSRAFPPTEAKQLIREICTNLSTASAAANRDFEVVLRGDSTLRGHFPDEPDAVEEVLGKFHAWILAPFFYQGGRLTVNDVHYVAEGDELVPASQTPFAKDATFGYKSSNLVDYIEEKTKGRFDEKSVLSITIDDIRNGGPARVAEKLQRAPARSIVIVNAAAEEDMFVFAAGLVAAESLGLKFLYRTGAAFVSSRLGMLSQAPLGPQDLGLNSRDSTTGGLIVAGSYVPKTTAQLLALRKRRGAKLHVVELNVRQLIDSEEVARRCILTAAAEANATLASGMDVLLMTSRELVVGKDALSSLNIGSTIAASLISVVQAIQVQPRYLIAKGGITSSDVATKGLNIKKATVLGQAAPGVPLWRSTEATARFSGLPYVVFPGNVGTNDTLADVVDRWA